MILEEIANKTKERIVLGKKEKSLDTIKGEVKNLPIDTGFPFEKALRTKEIAFVCEIKKASPSKGVITREFPYIEIAKEYEKAGANAISVLTEPYYFKGSNRYISDIKPHISIPILRKDFIVDEYMIYEAKIIGADAVLLICAILDDESLKKYLELAHSLGLSALVEAHDEDEVRRAISAGARIVGVNNRDLRDFTVDMNTSLKLRKLVSGDCIFVSESGISTREDIEVLEEKDVDAVLIGEVLMKSKDKKRKISALRGVEIENEN